MLYLLGICLLLSSYISLSIEQTCNSTFATQYPPIASVCPFDNPYCRMIPTTQGNINYECRACFSQCDCANDEFCSSNPSTFGTCVQFNKGGQSCLPLTGPQLTDSSIPDSWKCAMTFTFQGNLQVDYAGTCINEKCQMCNPLSFFDRCLPGSGTQNERICAYPGMYTNTHSYLWTYRNVYSLYFPSFTWWPILFCFTVVLLGVQITIFVFKLKSGDFGTGKEPKPKHDETEMQQKHEPEVQPNQETGGSEEN